MAVSTTRITELPPYFLHTFSFRRLGPRNVPFFLVKPFSSSPGSVKWPVVTYGVRGVQTVPFSRMRELPDRISESSKPPSQQTEKPETVRSRTTAIDRIVLRLRNLGLVSDEEKDGIRGNELGPTLEDSNDAMIDEFGDEKLGDLLKRDWVRPDTILAEDEDYDSLLPWERSGNEHVESETRVTAKRTEMRAPTMAELTIEDEELRRLRRMGTTLKERISVPKAGITGAILEKIHEKWRKSELVRLKFHEELAQDMKTAHEIVEKRTGGLVTWRSGSVMVVFRGINYEGPGSRSHSVNSENDGLFVPYGSSNSDEVLIKDDAKYLAVQKSSHSISNSTEGMTEEEIEYNKLLDDLGPRFEEWWGTGVLPVDADLLPPTIPGYKTPFRLLPTGMRSGLTNAEMTNLRKLSKSLPVHFALGRNRNHQGLASSIVKLWEKSLLVKIAVKRGIQNTNNKIMAEELKILTGGLLLLRNKYYIIMYRGKDFLPPMVAAALAERHELTKQIQDVEEKVRRRPASPVNTEEREASVGTLSEFYEAQASWGIDVSLEDRKKMMQEASRSHHMRLVKRLERKMATAQSKKLRAEKLLSKIVDSWAPISPSDDQETITDEERVMFRRVGLRMTPYLPVGIRGIFDGVIENMHLHWKHRELVKLISKEKETSSVEETAKLLEYESGGILVAIEKVPKGHILIYYRGKNYRRPLTLRPRNLLTKAKALKRRVALQRYEAISEHISELEKTITQAKQEIAKFEHTENRIPEGDSSLPFEDTDEDSEIDLDLDSDSDLDEKDEDDSLYRSSL